MRGKVGKTRQNAEAKTKGRGKYYIKPLFARQRKNVLNKLMKFAR